MPIISFCTRSSKAGSTQASETAMKFAITSLLMLVMMSVLVLVIIVLSILLYKRGDANTETQIRVIQQEARVVDSPDSPPIYPKSDPVYPLRGTETTYQQMGVLTTTSEGSMEPLILPLYGRPIRNGDRWMYYAASDKYHMWKIPVSFESKEDCQEEVGCREIYNGDKVSVPIYQKEFTAQIYKYNTLKYDPRV